MSRLAWLVLTGVIVLLTAGVLILDRHQARRGVPSLFALPWAPSGPEAVAARRRRGAAPDASAGTTDARSGPRDSPWRIAVIVTELGSRADVFERVVALRRPVAVAVLPGLALSRRIAREAPRAGLEVLLQLPLEPYRFPGIDPGPATLTRAMSPAEIAQRTREQVGSLSGVVGVVTQMGSRFTEDRVRMGALLEVVRGEKLFFVDSVTTQWSVGYDLARALGLRAARRQVFLDPDDDEAMGRARLEMVERWAARRGSVVVIGRGRLLTLSLLEAALPRWEDQGFRLVPVSALLDPPVAVSRLAPERGVH